MKKFFKTSLVALAALLTITVANSFVPMLPDPAFKIESIDGTGLNINFTSTQVRSMYRLLPEKYREMLDESYERFRTKTLSAGYEKVAFVDGFKCTCTKSDNGDIYTIAGPIEGLGYHTLKINVDSRDNFISWMDDLILD